jgi:hypothetical protein
MPLLVFGVVRADHPSPGGGDADGDRLGVALVQSGEVAAAVTEIADDQELSEEDATWHLDTLILLLRDGPLLPLAFGTVSPDEDAVRAEVLDPVADDLVRRLDAVDGFVEARFEVFFDEAAALKQVMQGDPDLQGLAAESRDGGGLDVRIALGEAVSGRLTEWRRQQAEEMLPALAESAESVVELESHEPLQQRWAFLVREDRLEELDQAVGKVRSSLGTGAAVEYVGPLPVYSFLAQLEPTPPPAEQRSAWGW